jgi:hypothetical protein
MPEADALLEAAGLPSAEVDAWRASAPGPATSFDEAAAATSAHLARGEELLGRLPARPDRNEAEEAAASALRAALDAARAQFLRAHVDARLRRADRRPAPVGPRRRARLRGRGAVPGPGAHPRRRRGRTVPTAAGEGRGRDRAGPPSLLRAGLTPLRLAPRLVDAASDRERPRAARRVPGDRRRRPRRHVPRAAGSRRLPRDPQRPPPERRGLRDAPHHGGRRRPGAARPRGRGGGHPRRRSSAIRATPAGASSAPASTSRTCTTAASTSCSSSRATSAT